MARFGPRGAGKRMRTSVAVGIAILGAVGLVAGGWFLALLVRSPAQVEAAAAPPAAQPILVAVETGTLASTVSVRADIKREFEWNETFPNLAESAVVTRMPKKVGATLKACSVVSEVNGRPLLVVPGKFPFYRDLVRGSSGPDVMQLQKALVGCGAHLTPDGRFGGGTESALRAVYRAAGYEAPSPTTPTEDSESSAFSVPRSELLVVPSVPATLLSAPEVGIGLDATSSIQIGRGDPVAVATVPGAVASTLAPGMSVTLTNAQGESIAGHIDSLLPTSADSTPPSPEVEGVGAPDAAADTSVRISGDDGTPVPTSWLGSNVLGAITVELLAEDALLVPSIAVVTGPDPYVVVERGDDSLTAVPVTELATLDGRSAIRPREEGALTTGDLVRVG